MVTRKEAAIELLKLDWAKEGLLDYAKYKILYRNGELWVNM